MIGFKFIFLFCFSFFLKADLFPCDPKYPEICIIDKEISSKTNITFDSSTEIFILYTNVTCQIPCSINFNSPSKITIFGSFIYASSITLFANEQISISNSLISTNGTIAKGRGYTPLILEGFGYAGMGSVCIWWEDVVDNSYGPNCAQYDDLEYLHSDETQGSGGVRYFEKGGGRIVIKTYKYLLLSNSSITASGYPSNENSSFCESISNLPYSKGGTGGFILLEAEEITANISRKTHIEAKGGHYCGIFKEINN